MKTKFLFWSAVLFLVLAISARHSALFYFFSIHLFMLFISVLIHRCVKKNQSSQTVESLPEAGESGHSQ